MSTESPTPTRRRRFRMSGKKWLWLSLAVVVIAGVGGYLLLRIWAPRGAAASTPATTAGASDA